MQSLFNKNNSFTFLNLHIIVIIFGFSGVLGKLIELDAIHIVLFRTLIAALTLIFWGIITKNKAVFEYKSLKAGALVGIILAFHWLTFFHAIKVSNVSVTLGCLGTASFFAAIIEPISDKKKMSFIDILASIIIIVGIYIIFRFEFRFAKGILFAVISALLAAIFSVINKHLSKTHDYKSLGLSQLSIAFGTMLVISLFKGYNLHSITFQMHSLDYVYLILLGTIGTAYAYTETISIIKKLSAYTVVLAINLEPVYGIILAILVFGETEKMTSGFFIGAAIILTTVIFYSFKEKLISPKIYSFSK
jgi:drug/metabolite transporter (DMT)-like permease